MKPTRLKKEGKHPVSKIKKNIQYLLREIGIKRDGGCVLRNSTEAGICGGYRNDGELILQAEHLNSRKENISFADMRNIVIICKRHHFYFKPQYSRLYWELIEKIIGKERWEWIKKCEKDSKSHHMTAWDWRKQELALKQELKQL